MYKTARVSRSWMLQPLRINDGALFDCDVSGLSEAKSRALDNLGRVHARIGNFQKAIDVYVVSFCLAGRFENAVFLFCRLL